MAQANYLLHQIETWEHEGLISHEQAEALKQRELDVKSVRRVQADEIFVYLGTLVVFLASAFLVFLNWQTLGQIGRVLAVLVPTVAMLALGGWLRQSDSPRLLRGAQALWLGGSLLTGFTFGVIFNEYATLNWSERAIGDPWVLLSCLLATSAAAIAFAWLPTVTQSVALHLCGSAVMLSFLNWLMLTIPRPSSMFRDSLIVLAIALVFGGAGLALSEWLRPRAGSGVVRVSRLFGMLTILFLTFFTALMEYPALWQKVMMEMIALLASVGFLVASIRRQSRTFLYSGAAFLLFVVTEINFAHFADRVGMPIALFIVGILLIVLGLGTERLRRRIRPVK